MSVFILERPTSKIDPKTGKPICKYHVRWAHDETYTYLGSLPTKQLAEKRKKVVEGLVAVGSPVSLEMFKGKPAVQRMRLDEAAQRYMDSQTGWAESTRKNNEGYRKAVLEYWGAHIDPHKITPEEVTAWIASMKARKLSAATMRLRKVFLTGTLGPTGARVTPNPCKSAEVGKIKGRAKRKPLPTVAQLAATREALDAQSRLIFDMQEHSGMRPGEARKLTWGQVDNQRDRLMGVGTKTEEREVRRLDWQPDWIPTRPEGAKDSDLLVRMSEATYYGRLAKASGGVINPNLLRHVHASRLFSWKGVKHDMEVPDMAARMGHSHEQFLRTYTHRSAPLD